jgi:hypothetical protein
LGKNRSLWDEFDKLYEKHPKGPSDEFFNKVNDVAIWVATKTAKRPLTAMEIDGIYTEAKRKLHKLLAS